MASRFAPRATSTVQTTPSACQKPLVTTIRSAVVTTPRWRPRYAASALRSGAAPRGSGWPRPLADGGAQLLRDLRAQGRGRGTIEVDQLVRREVVHFNRHEMDSIPGPLSGYVVSVKLTVARALLVQMALIQGYGAVFALFW